MDFDDRTGECSEDDRDAEIIRMARATSEGVLPFSEILEQLERLHGERLVPAEYYEISSDRVGECL